MTRLTAWLKALFRPSRTAYKEENARRALQALREGELSVGAHLRQGRVVDRAPGQVFAPAQVRASHAGPPHAQAEHERAPAAERRPHEDVATSFAVGAATGSLPVGYLAGGSVLGAAAGAASAAAVEGQANDRAGPATPTE